MNSLASILYSSSSATSTKKRKNLSFQPSRQSTRCKANLLFRSSTPKTLNKPVVTGRGSWSNWLARPALRCSFDCQSTVRSLVCISRDESNGGTKKKSHSFMLNENQLNRRERQDILDWECACVKTNSSSTSLVFSVDESSLWSINNNRCLTNKSCEKHFD